MASERGQATVEWTGLVLLATLALGALCALAPRIDGAGLGALVAERVTTVRPRPAGTATRPRSESRPTRGPWPAPDAAPASGASPPRNASPARATAAFQSLRRVRVITSRVWIACLGYQRWRFEYEHPRAPNQALPVKEALRIANGCLNPVGFLTGG